MGKTSDILSMTITEIEELMIGINQPKYRAKQVWGWLHKNAAQSFENMVNLPSSLRTLLQENYHIATVTTVEKLVSERDKTAKFLFALHDDALIEAVFMEYAHGTSVCVSTQVGCRMGCAFCASTQGGLTRNLTAGEMCAQVYAVEKGAKVGGIVLMGCGEPLDNFDSTLRFIELITAKEGINIGQRHITLSTCGLVPQILELAERKLQITLAISLHAPTDEIRKQFMPIAKLYPLSDLINACKKYVQATSRRITFEYALAKGKNDSLAHARELVKLLRGINCHVNLIPINKARDKYSGSSQKDISAFADILQKGRIQTTVRRSLGSDVNAACGQLRAGHKQG